MIHDRINVYTNAPSMVKYIQEFALDLYQGRLKMSIELANTVLWRNTDDNDAIVKKTLERDLRDLRDLLQKADKPMQDTLDDDGGVRKSVFTFRSEK